VLGAVRQTEMAPCVKVGVGQRQQVAREARQPAKRPTPRISTASFGGTAAKRTWARAAHILWNHPFAPSCKASLRAQSNPHWHSQKRTSTISTGGADTTTQTGRMLDLQTETQVTGRHNKAVHVNGE
jgi:hypothetical protein